jgi:hypothetical protein
MGTSTDPELKPAKFPPAANAPKVKQAVKGARPKLKPKPPRRKPK